MPYLPFPIEHDLFLSYAHEDQKWVTALQEQLIERLVDRLGCDCDIWQHNNLFMGQYIPDELDKAIRSSAAFIAVLSRNYQSSNWCEKELAAFLDETQGKDGLETGGHGRMLKVIKFPWVDNAHEDFYPDYRQVPFFDRGKTGQQREFRRTSEAFRKAVDKLSFHIEKLFEAMLLGLEKVFVARAAEDAGEQREAIIREIRAAGHGLSPPLGVIPEGLNRNRLLKYIGEARVSVHVLGVTFDQAVREQIDLALEAGKKTIFYLTRGHEAARGEQRALIDEIRGNKWNLAAGSWALLDSRSPAVELQDLIELLRPAHRAATSVRNETRAPTALRSHFDPRPAATGVRDEAARKKHGATSDIFLSYARKDLPRVKPVVDSLLARGWSVWWDPKITPGQTWDEVIQRALDAARCVIVLWSQDSVHSEWVQIEAYEGKRRGILIPALLDDIPASIPLAFKRTQAANLIGWTGALPHAGFHELATAVEKLLATDSAP